MKVKILATILCTLFLYSGFSQAYIDEQQKRIDGLDGKVDEFIAIIDLDIRNAATHTYIVLVDDLQKAILDNDFIDIEDKVFLYKKIHIMLSSVDGDKLVQSVKDEKAVSFLLDFVREYGTRNMINFLKNNSDESFSILKYIAPFPETKFFLYELPSNYTDQLLYQYEDYRNMPYAQELIENVIVKAPATAKKYFIQGQPIYVAMQLSDSVAIRNIISINETYRRNTKAYILLDKIMNGKLNIDQADAIGNMGGATYFQNLLEIRAKKNPYAEVSLDREISYVALEYVREVNHLHEETNPNVRFAIIKDLNASELYTLLVYGEDEIFTSSFNGVYKELVAKMQAENLSGYHLLELVGFNKFRMFIKMLSYYGSLNSFLETMNATEKETVLRKFVQGIENAPDRIAQAVSVADAISAIEDKSILLILEESFYTMMNKSNLDQDAQLIYSLLIKMFNNKVQKYHSFFNEVANRHYIPPIEKISRAELLGMDNKNVQKHFFYDDDDGKASYNSFVASFRNKAHWSIQEEKEYIKIVSDNNLVKIYANKPKYDETAWYYVDKEMKRNYEETEFIIHRGHSYYVDYTIEQIPKSSKLIMLGSCGGYNKLSSLLDKSDNAHIISTKQIGSMGVNNPLIFKMAERIRKGNNLDWPDYWAELKVHFKDAGKTKERFYDYVPPHQNLGAKFIAAYKALSYKSKN